MAIDSAQKCAPLHEATGRNIRSRHRLNLVCEVVQVVREINKRTGAQLDSGAVANPNGRGTGKHGVENACGLDSVRGIFNESTLYSIGSQYARDVLKFGYL